MPETEIIDIIKKYMLLLNEADIPVEKAFLFGSYLHNKANEDSDIDVMLVSEKFDSDGLDSKIKAWSITRKVDTRIEPYTIGLNKFFSDLSSPLLQLVKKEGFEIKI